MPQPQVFLTCAAKQFPSLNDLYGFAYRVNLERSNEPVMGLYWQNSEERNDEGIIRRFDELDCLYKSLVMGHDAASRMMAEKGSTDFVLHVQTDHGLELPNLMCQEKPHLYEQMYLRFYNERNPVQFRRNNLAGVNPLSEAIWMAALQGATQVQVDLKMTTDDPPSWMTLKNAVHEIMNRDPDAFSPTLTDLAKNQERMEKIGQWSAEARQYIETAIAERKIAA